MLVSFTLLSTFLIMGLLYFNTESKAAENARINQIIRDHNELLGALMGLNTDNKADSK